jgi:hypothetical protein
MELQIADFDTALTRYYNVSVPERETSREVKNPGTLRRALIGKPKGGFMEPMKIPIRVLGMVFQVDKECP